MARKSEKPRDTRISATDASRTFSDVLDQVEAGRRFLVQRRGRDVCVMSPVSVDRRSAAECLRALRRRSEVFLDDRFGADLLDAIETSPVDQRPSWVS